MSANTDRMLSMIDSAVAGAAPFLPVRLVVFPEFAHAAPVFPTAAELIEKLAVAIPNEHTARLEQKAKEHDIYIQSGSMLEADPKWPSRSSRACDRYWRSWPGDQAGSKDLSGKRRLNI